MSLFPKPDKRLEKADPERFDQEPIYWQYVCFVASFSEKVI